MMMMPGNAAEVLIGTSGAEFDPVPDGWHLVVLASILVRQGAHGSYHEWIFECLQLTDASTSERPPRRKEIRFVCSSSMARRSKQRRWIQQWFAKPMLDSQASRFNLLTLLERTAVVRTEQNTSVEGREFAKPIEIRRPTREEMAALPSGVSHRSIRNHAARRSAAQRENQQGARQS